MTTNPLVSVIMPVLNEQRYISQAIESILNQTYKNIELIIIDDYSTDKSLEIARSYQQKDDRVVIFSKTNEIQRAGISRNIGVRLAKGDFIAFQDADDTSELDRIFKQLNKALEKPGKILVGCFPKMITDNSSYILTLPTINEDIQKGFKVIRGRGRYFVMGTSLGPKHFFLNNPCKEILRYLEDWDQLLRISENEDFEMSNIPEALYTYNLKEELTIYKKGWIESNLFVRFSQRMRKRKYSDPTKIDELNRYLYLNPIELFLYLLFKFIYILKLWASKVLS